MSWRWALFGAPCNALDGNLQGRGSCSTCVAVYPRKSCCLCTTWGMGSPDGRWLLKSAAVRGHDAYITSREASQRQSCGVHVLLQETEGSHVAVRPERRRQAIEELVAAGPQALQVLAACLPQDGGHGQAAA